LGLRKNIRRFIRGRTDDVGSAVLETLIDEARFLAAFACWAAA
jgi:hypothetical protein